MTITARDVDAVLALVAEHLAVHRIPAAETAPELAMLAPTRKRHGRARRSQRPVADRSGHRSQDTLARHEITGL
jgi:hypothetical protein